MEAKTVIISVKDLQKIQRALVSSRKALALLQRYLTAAEVEEVEDIKLPKIKRPTDRQRINEMKLKLTNAPKGK